MDRPAGHAWLDVLRELVDGAHLWQPDELAPAVDAALSRLDVTSRIWMVDYEQTALVPLPHPGRSTPDPLPVDGSPAGQAFTGVRSVPLSGGEAGRWWVPIVDGTDRLGVLEFAAVPPRQTLEPGLLPYGELIAGLVGHLLASVTERGDLVDRLRRSQPMSTASELLWRTVPPLTASSRRAVVSAVLQPCYDVGGDGFDYAFNGPVLHLVVLDAAGRGLDAALTCAVALAAVRATRRAGRDLDDQARATDSALAAQFTDSRFATAVLAELDLRTGRVRYVNAGHPAPLVLRDGRVAAELDGGRRLPLGLGDPVFEVGEQALVPEDRLLFYTDGVTEARTPEGARFGLGRLAELAERHDADGRPVPETLRRLAHAVLAHQGGPPADDATLMLAQWSAAAALNTVPGAGRPAGADEEKR